MQTTEFFESSVFFGVFISLASYTFGVWLKKRTGWALANPLLIAIVLVVATLSLLGISYESYAKGAGIINYLLTPATICLADCSISSSKLCSFLSRRIVHLERIVIRKLRLFSQVNINTTFFGGSSISLRSEFC